MPPFRQSAGTHEPDPQRAIEAKCAALSNLADIMGRAVIHSGKVITWDETMASNFQFCPDLDKMDYDTTPPMLPDTDGRYPVPVPGMWNEI